MLIKLYQLELVVVSFSAIIIEVFMLIFLSFRVVEALLLFIFIYQERRTFNPLCIFGCSIKCFRDLGKVHLWNGNFPAGNYMFRVNNRNTRTRCEIYSELTIKWYLSVIFIVNFEHISHPVLVFLLLTLSM